MTFSNLLNPDLVLIRTDCASKDDLIAILTEKIHKADIGIPVTQSDLLASIYTREKIGGTLLPSGLSVPHSRLGNYEDIIIALATPKEPLFHEELQIRLMALMISSQTGGLYYLPTIAALTKISRDSEYFSRLCAAGDKEEFLKILMEKDPELK